MVLLVEGKWRFIRGCAFLGEPGIGGDERFCRRYLGSYDLYTEDCLCRYLHTIQEVDIQNLNQHDLKL